MIKLLTFLVLVSFVSCNSATTKNEIGIIELQMDLSENYVFDYMKDIYEFDNNLYREKDVDSTISTTVNLVVINDTKNRFFIVDRMACRSWIQDDSLWIQLSSSSGFEGRGLNIKLKNGRFRCIPFYWTDNIVEGEKDPIISIEKQMLVLNRKTFQIGDSLYGHVYLRAIIDGREKNYATGFFRTKIKNNR